MKNRSNNVIKLRHRLAQDLISGSHIVKYETLSEVTIIITENLNEIKL